MGFGASAHIVLKIVQHLFPSSNVYVYARHQEERQFASESGAAWTGNPKEIPPVQLHAIIDTTPAWECITYSLKNLMPGGRLVINAISKESDDQQKLLELNYQEHLWLEKEIKTVANITRKDVEEFLKLASAMMINPEIVVYGFHQVNHAIMELHNKSIRGAKVIKIAGNES